MKLILHIGRPKTGTTSLQHFLATNRDSLSEAGYYLFEGMGKPNNIHLPAFFLKQGLQGLCVWFTRQGLTSIEEKDDYLRSLRFMESIDGEVRAAQVSHHTALITSEQLSSALTRPKEISPLAQWATQRFTSVQVVCFVRNQVDAIPSGWSMGLKGGKTRSLARLLKENSAFGPLNYLSLAESWSKHFGEQNLAFHVFHNRSGWDIRRFFVENYLPGAEGLTISPQRENRSYGVIDAFIVRMINIVFPLWKPGARQENPRNIRWRRRLLRLTPRKQRPLRLRPGQAERIRSVFAESNDQFSKRFLPPGENL